MKDKQRHIRTFPRKIGGWFHHILHLHHILYHGIYKRQNHLAYLETHLTHHCVSLNGSEPISRFLKFHLDLRGDSEPEKVLRHCRQQYYGRLFVCAAPALSHLPSDQSGDRLPLSNKDFICIYDDIAARDIIDYLSSPIPFCRFCTTDVTPYRWTTSKREREEWLEWFHLDGAITSVYNQL